MTQEAARIEYVPLSEVRGAPRNPKDHDVGAVHKSIARFGFVNVPVMDERTGRLVAGHGRLEALRAMKVGGQSPPERVKEEDGEWLVPVLRGVSFRSDEDAEAYLLADNRLTELGGWDDAALTEVLSDLAAADALDGVGWDADDVDAMIAEAERNVLPLGDPDDVPETPDEPVTRRGDVWLLGKHRMMCGDAIAITDVDALLDGAKPDMVYTDPPYGVSVVKGARDSDPGPFGGKAAGRVGVTSVVEAGVYAPIIGDDTTETAVDAYNLCAGLGINVLMFWGGNYYASALPDSSGWALWDKENDGNTFADGELAWTNQSKPLRIFRHKWQGMLRASERGDKRVHPTQKPVALAAWAFETYGPDVKAVLDLFAGSGSTLIACERSGKRGYMMELSERYCDLICRRFQEYSGVLPVLESTGESHDFTATSSALSAP